MRLTLLVLIANLALAIGANAVGTTWAQGGMKANLAFVAILLISPLVFLSFGFVAARLGLAAASATIDTLLTVGTMLAGLIWFGEWHEMSARSMVGLSLALAGIVVLNLPG
jgi:multidrug transporter EmrE-like cation transporter